MAQQLCTTCGKRLAHPLCEGRCAECWLDASKRRLDQIAQREVKMDDERERIGLGLEPTPPVPHAFIQWKGTNVCADLWCICGAQGHIDDEFMYFVRCIACGRVYRVGCHVTLYEVTHPAGLAQVGVQTTPSIDFGDVEVTHS